MESRPGKSFKLFLDVTSQPRVLFQIDQKVPEVRINHLFIVWDHLASQRHRDRRHSLGASPGQLRNREQPRAWPRARTLIGILAGIACAYFVPFNRIPGSAALVGSFAALIFAIPVFFAGLLFAAEFRSADSPAAALGANMLGAVVGGLLENLSLIIGNEGAPRA